MTPDIYLFMASSLREWRNIPGTWLEANPRGQLRDQRSKAWFGECLYLSDFPYLLAGLLPVWSPDVVKASTDPVTFFMRRSRDDPNSDRTRSDKKVEKHGYVPKKPDLFAFYTTKGTSIA